jgi:hypothetical protein
MIEEDHVLRPFNASEAIPVSIAAKIAGVSVRTIQHWCIVHRIGRRIANGPWRVSRPALQMLLDGDNAALRAYLSGERAGRVAAYLRRAV